MSCVNGGRTLVGRESVEVVTWRLAGAGGILVGRLDTLLTTLGLSCAEASVEETTKTNAAATDRYQIFLS